MLKIFAKVPKRFDRYNFKKNIKLFVKGEIYMNLGNKILELRKENKLSQEQLAEKLNVTRQTISNWELNETTPDLNQAKALSKIFNVSLDELTNNDVKNIIVEKVSNTERLAGILIKILKFVGIAILVMFIIDIIALIIFSTMRLTKTTTETQLSCTLNEQEYSYSIEYDEDNNIITAGGDEYIVDNVNTEKYSDAQKLITAIENYFTNNGGTCE